MLPIRWQLGIFVVWAALSFGQVSQPPQKLPVVKSGEMPFYPTLARTARVQGEVGLRVKTDGSSVVSVTSEYGNQLLAKAAQDNVRSWKFEPHEPTAFSTVFSYHLDTELATDSCDPDKPENETVVLRLPAQVEIASHLRIRDCHDAYEGLDLAEPLRVFLTACEVDGLSVPCEKLNIRLQSGDLAVAPARFKESEKKQGFVVPVEFRALKTFGVSVDTGQGNLLFTNQNIAFLKGNWRVGIDHAPFKENTPVYGTAATLPCVGFIHFEWGEPEVVTWAPCK
jgi:hypothetical protein